MAMVFLTDRKMNSSYNTQDSSFQKQNNMNLSQSIKNIDSSINKENIISRIKAPFNSQAKGHQFVKDINNYPGPGSYNLESDIIKPQLNASENMNFMANTPRFKNDNKLIGNNPGPGSYNINRGDKPLFQRRILHHMNSKNKSNNNYKYNSINSVSSIPSKNHNYGYLENEEGELIQAIVPMGEHYFSGEKNNSVGPGRYYIYFQEKNPIVKWNRMSARNLSFSPDKNTSNKSKNKNESVYSINSDLSKVETDISFANKKENKFEYKKFKTKNLMDKYKKNLNSSIINNHSNKKKEEADNIDIEKELEFLNSYETKNTKNIYPPLLNYNQMRYQIKPPEQQFFGSTVERGITHIPITEKILYPGPGTYFHETLKNFELKKNYNKKDKKIFSTFGKSKRADPILKKSVSLLGPGSYNVSKFDPNKKKSFNKYGNFSCEKRFPEVSKSYDGNNEEIITPGPGEYEIGDLWKKKLEKKKKNLIFVNVQKEIKKHIDKKEKEAKPDFNKYQSSQMINIIQTKINSKINPYSSRHMPFLSGLGRFKLENESDYKNNIGPGTYDLAKNLGKDYSKNRIEIPFNSYQEKDKGINSNDNINVSPQEYQQDSYFDWNKKSFNIMFV